jgi:broad specificity phosphatase PhoE
MLYLLRHGQTDWTIRPTRCQGWVDVPVNDVGREQARAEAERLANHGIRRVVTSHLLRARETAQIVRTTLEAAGSRRAADARGAEEDA